MKKQEIQNLENMRHSLAHLLAAAVLELWPDAKRTIGPAVENGFYYDFEFSKPIGDADLAEIEKKMNQILPTWTSFEGREISRKDAEKMFDGNPYKLELIKEYAEQGLTIFKSGDYEDLCRGGHAGNLAKDYPDLAFKLTHIAGAYWRGDEKNKMLTRIYGLAFPTKKELDEYLAMLEEAKKRDHKILGPQLDLFTFSDLIGGGLPLWTPKGTVLRDELDNFVWQLRKERGYERVDIPHITKKDLYEKSGHWEKFQDELFKIITREEHLFALKPMNCPHHTQIYARKLFSYKELPQKYASTTKVYRDEQSGELAGLVRVRAITQDDAHVFCRHSQVKEEILKIWDIIEKFYGAFGFDLDIRLSLSDPSQPEKYLGPQEVWKKAEDELRKIISEKSVEATEALGEAAFYGPKIDFMGKDSIGREHQVATIQLDMNMPERFDLTCINEKGEKERIVMVHAAIMGSIERFLSVLIEHYAGAFPVWLSPVQVSVLPISDKVADYTAKIIEELKSAGLRVESDERSESIGKKIRDAEMQKIPYLVVIGEKESSAGSIAVRQRGKIDLGAMPVSSFLEKIKKEIDEKK